MEEGSTQGSEAKIRSFFEDNKPLEDLGKQALRGGAASIVGRFGSGMIQMISAVILARLLVPEDFGLVTMVTVLTSFAPYLIDLGLGDATTQKAHITRGQVSSLFWVSCAIGLFIGLVLVACSPWIARLYGEPRLQSIAMASSVTFLLMGMPGQHMALLRRKLQFGIVARIEITSYLVGMILASILALTGYGYWALVVRPVLSAACMVAGAWLACPWRPGFPEFDKEVKTMIQFGMRVLGFTLTTCVSRAVDRVGLGLFYSPREVGLYQNALALYENSIFALLVPLHSVGSAALSKLQSQGDRLREKYLTALSTLAFFVMPLSAVLSVIAPDIVVLLLGDKWWPAGGLLSVLALRGMLHAVDGSQGWLHLSAGRADRWMNWGIVTAIVQILAVIVCLPYGPQGMAISFVAAGWLLAFPSIGYAGAPVGINMIMVARAVGRQLAGAILTVAAGWLLRYEVLGNLWMPSRALVLTLFCISVYLLIVVILFRVTEPMKLIGRLLHSFSPRWVVSWLKGRASS